MTTKRIIAASAFALLFTAGTALAQTTGYPGYPTPNTGPGSTGASGMTASPNANMTASPNVNLGTGTPSSGGPTAPSRATSAPPGQPVGVPNTGAGGNAVDNAAVLGASLAVVLAAAGILIARRKSA